MYIPEVQNEKNSNELPVFIYRKSYKSYFCIFRGPKEILRGPKKQSSPLKDWEAQIVEWNGTRAKTQHADKHLRTSAYKKLSLDR